MPETSLGIKYPRADDLIKSASAPSELVNDFMELAVSANDALIALYGISDETSALVEQINKTTMQFKDVGNLPPLKNDWIGLDKGGWYRLPNQAATAAITDRPAGSGPALVGIYPMGAGGSLIIWREYSGQMRVWHRSVSLTSSNNTDWILQSTTTRRVLHQLSQPGNANLRDTATTRHARVPVMFPVDVCSSDLVLANRNEQLGVGFGDLDMAEVFVGKTLIGTFGQRTGNFDGAPTSLGVPTPVGSAGTRRYPIGNLPFMFKANTEYLISYGFTNPNPDPAHMGYGGAWLGTDPSMTGRYDPPVNLTWSPNIPMDVYLTLRVPSTVPVITYIDSSTLTGYGSPYPLRDNYGWKDAAAKGALPVLLGQSGSTLEGWSNSTRYVWNKVGNSFDRCDLCYVGLGSNDTNLGRTISQMKTDLASVVSLVREKITDNVGYVNIFGRASESADVLASRAEWNEYLNTLPNRASIAIDRTKAVEGDNRLMLPIYNSGDGTHVKDIGQDQFAAAMIRSEKYVPNLNRYSISEVAGRVVTVWDYLNNREQLIYGDTEERNIASLFTAGGTHGGFTLRRVGQTCTLTLYNWAPNAAGSGNLAVIPTGFRPRVTHGVPAQGLSSRLQVTPSGNVQAYNWTTASVVGSIVWTTSDPWPTSLPGTPV